MYTIKAINNLLSLYQSSLKAAQELQEHNIWCDRATQSWATEDRPEKKGGNFNIDGLSKKSDTATVTDNYSIWLMLYKCILGLECLYILENL